MQARQPTARPTRPSNFLAALLRAPAAPLVLQNLRTGHIVASRLVTAFDSRARRTGLLHRTEMAAGDAMIIAPTNAIHTCGMRFAIDVIFAARDGRVMKTRRAVRPWRAVAAWRAWAVIELPAGTLEASATVAGDRLLVTRADLGGSVR